MRLRTLGHAALLAAVSLLPGACATRQATAPDANDAAPEIRIVEPVPSADVVHEVGRSATVRFDALDPDAPRGRAASFRYVLLDHDSDLPLPAALADPDSVRRFYAPGFEEWTALPGTASWVSLEDMQPDREYLLVITALDAEGAYDPVFALDRNMVRLRAREDEGGGPTLWFGDAAASPGVVRFFEWPAGTPLHLSWHATPKPGTFVCGYRVLLDDAPFGGIRSRGCGRTCDPRCWNPELKSVALGPYAGGETHLLTIEASDNLGRVARASLSFGIVATSARPLLIVDDTRLRPDTRPSGSTCTDPPVGAWPTAAELDTFLFAGGGFPWRCYGPAGTTSSPGLFAGYPFDTIGTRTGQTDPTIPLARLQQYRHVVWIVDAEGAQYTNPAGHPVDPMTALRYMSQPGRLNTLSAYAAGGGRVWLVGGSAMTGELAPGTFMYDRAHWRSERRAGRLPASVLGVPGAPAHVPPMRAKSPALDPLPPGRTSAQFYLLPDAFEYLSMPNVIVENGGSVLDSLYGLHAPTIPAAYDRIVMTHYRGSENGPVTFTGFEPWRYTRADAQALVDYVLGDLWGIPKSAAHAAH